MNSTERNIKKAILAILKGRPKVVESSRRLSITAVAEEAGIHRTTIINRYPVLADEIRNKCGYKNSNNRSDQRIRELSSALKESKIKIKSLEDQLAKAISLQASANINKL